MRALFFALLALLAVHSATLAEERIEQFTSDALVNDRLVGHVRRRLC